MALLLLLKTFNIINELNILISNIIGYRVKLLTAILILSIFL